MAAADKINLAEKLATFSEHWNPKLVDTIDDYDIKLVKLLGDFVWHSHAGGGRALPRAEGRLPHGFPRPPGDASRAGEMIVVPRGVEHKPFAEQECEILLLERRGVVNTGNADPGALTRSALERI